MGLQRVILSNIELISVKDEAVVSLDPLVLKEGIDPFVFVFKSNKDLGVRKEYLKTIIQLQKLLPILDEKDLQKRLAELSVEEQVDVVEKINELQTKVVELLLIGYKQGVNGELIGKTPDIIDLLQENEVIVEFFTKLVNENAGEIDKKKS